MPPSTSTPTSNRLTRAAQQEATRARLLEAAERVFTAQGFHATSLEDIAEAAGYSKGAVYSNFEGKDDLFLAVLERRIDTPIHRIEAAITAGASMEAQAGQAADAWLDVFRDSQWRLLLLEFATYAARRPDLRQRYLARNRELRRDVPDLIERRLDALGVERRLPTPDLAAIFFALGTGFLLEKMIDPDAVPDSLFGDALVLLLRGLEAAAADPN